MVLFDEIEYSLSDNVGNSSVGNIVQPLIIEVVSFLSNGIRNGRCSSES